MYLLTNAETESLTAVKKVLYTADKKKILSKSKCLETLK